jgi:hypothetical protein
MKVTKAVLVAIAVSGALLILGACGPGDQEEPSPPAVEEPAPASGEESAPEPTEEPDTEEGGTASLEPLDIELPEPMFEGTPRPVDEPNVEKPSGKQRPPFLAPPGTENLALGEPVTSSDEWPIIGNMELVTDGDKEAYQGSFVELGPGTQWVQIDLGQKSTIYAVIIWHYHAQARVYRDVIVQVSDDPDFIADVKTVFNNDHDNSSGLGVGSDKGYVETFEGKLVDCKGVEGRYVRLYSNGNSSNESNHYIEVEVYGKPAE